MNLTFVLTGASGAIFVPVVLRAVPTGLNSI